MLRVSRQKTNFVRKLACLSITVKEEFGDRPSVQGVLLVDSYQIFARQTPIPDIVRQNMREWDAVAFAET